MKRRSFFEKIRSAVFREDHVCPWWLAYTFDNPLRRFLHDPDALLAPHVRPGMTVADIGCGMGYFSLALARLVGNKGHVLAVDLQQEMLDRVRKRAIKQGVAGTIRTVLAAKDDVRISGPVDFILTFWMVHEVGDTPRFFRQLAMILSQNGRILIAEPRMHVSQRRYSEILQMAHEAGFRVLEAPKVGLSRSAILVKK
jgi:ubiquinone/menaquinone biosynthesis C-methylase UbiE